MVNWQSKKTTDILTLANGIVLIILINMITSFFFFRIDLTEEKRFSLKPQTIEILRGLDDVVYIDVFLEGDLNASFTRFRKSILETLEEFRVYSGNRIRYRFVDPNAAASQQARSEFMADLAARGVRPTNVIDRQDGQRVEKIIFPGAIVSYGGQEKGVMLLKGNKASSPEEEINQSIEGVEYELASAVYTLSNMERRRVGLVTGHGELDSIRSIGLKNTLQEVYEVSEINLTDSALGAFDVLIVAKPTRKFAEADKFRLDQYVMRGGKVIFFLDKLEVTMDSVSQPNYLAFPYNTDIDDLLFRYGVRINMDLVQDRSAGFYPVVVGQSGSRPQMQLMQWPFFPLLNRYADHPVTRNLDAVLGRFVSSMDTVKASGVRKTALITSSQYARKLSAPVPVSINQLRAQDDATQFKDSYVPIAYLLEGTFTSLFKNRFLPEGLSGVAVNESVPTKVIVVADGDLAENQINPRSRRPPDLGFDIYTNTTFGNKDLVMNMVAYLTADQGLINARTKEIKIRPLDREKIAAERLKWQLINLAIPLVAIVAFGLIRAYLRRKKYASFA